MSGKSVKGVESSIVVLGNASGDVKNVVINPSGQEAVKTRSNNEEHEAWHKRPVGIITMSIVSITIASVLVAWLTR